MTSAPPTLTAALESAGLEVSNTGSGVLRGYDKESDAQVFVRESHSVEGWLFIIVGGERREVANFTEGDLARVPERIRATLAKENP